MDKEPTAMMTTVTGAALLESIRTRRARAGVVGLGYVGLPLAVELARAGFDTTGIDLDANKVSAVNAGRSYIDDVPTADVAALHARGRLRATGSFDAVAELDTITICVPTPLGKAKDPDLSFVVAAADAVATRLHPGMLIVLESTTYPGTTDELVLPILERMGLCVGRDFFLAFSPERVDPGNREFNTANVPKVIGGVSPDCTALATALYGSAIQTIVPVSSPRVAEMVKLLENTFRAVNIGLVNELALMCDRMSIDVWEVVRAAATKPFGFMPFYPGPGLGGHCIPIDPFYLSWKARQSGFEARFIELAGMVNGAMPHYVTSLVADALNAVRKPLNGSRVLVAGVAYKRDVDDIRESPALDLLALLQARGAVLAYSDPYVPRLAGHVWHGGVDLQHVDLAAVRPGTYDCAVVVTDHSTFDYDLLQRVATVVVDTRNAIRAPGPNVVRLGAPRRAELLTPQSV
ncbi:MAG: nucleotide sugar dehydrogenase [Vicinamibacterales bacterium]